MGWVAHDPSNRLVNANTTPRLSCHLLLLNSHSHAEPGAADATTSSSVELFEKWD